MPATPPGWHTITPRTFTPEPAMLAAFLHAVFGAEGIFQDERPTELRIGDSWLMVSGTEAREAMGAFLYVYVDDPGATFERALKAGAELLEAPRDLPYGDRRATFADRFGNTYQVASRKELGRPAGPA